MFKPNLKSLLLILALAVLPFQSFASHLLGGEIIWRCQNNGKYIFTMTLYRDCGGINLSYLPQTLQNNAGVTITLDSLSSEYILPYCYSNTTPSCSGATSGTGSMEKVVYQSQEITLYGSPPASGWYFSWQSCCRPISVSNTQSGGYHLRANMYPFTPTGSSSPLSSGDSTSNTATCYDSSPDFLEGPQARTCANENNILISNLGLDRDLDSLYYRFAEPMVDSANSVSWDSGYSAQSPLPSDISSVPARIDSTTGIITFNSSMIGSWASCVEIESWRGSQMVAKVYRDIPIFTLGCVQSTGLCSSAAVASAPSFELINDTNSNPVTILQALSGDTLLYRISASPGDIVSFTLKARDLTPHADCSSESLTMNAFGATLSDSLGYSSTSSCLLSSPCATLTSNGVNGAFTANDSLDVVFNWTVTTDHLSPVLSGTILPASYPFYFKVTDDECPVNRSSNIVVIVEVRDPVSSAPNTVSSCVRIDSSGIRTFDWIPDLDTANWGAYVIYSIDTSLSLIALDTLYNWSSSNYIDSNVMTLSSIGYIVAATNSTFTSWNYSQPITSIVNVSVFFNGSSFITTPGYSNYQWVLCDSLGGYTTIPNANSNSFSPNSSGDYAVLIIDGTCNIISDCLSFIISPFGIVEGIEKPLMYPNPNSSGKLSFSKSNMHVSITDVLGRQLKTYVLESNNSEIDISNLSKGAYIVTGEQSGMIFRYTLIVL